MPDQGLSTQQAPIVAPDLSTGGGFIDKAPVQAPLPAVNIPGRDGSGPNGGSTAGTMSISDLFTSMKSSQDAKQYNNPDYTPQQLTKRYSTWNPNIDNEAVAAANQSSFAKWGNALVKTGATVLSTVAQSLMTIPDTIQALGSGKISDLYQSPLENQADTFMKNIEDKFPNYYSPWEQEHPFLSAIPFSGGFANFWSDKVVKNLGFTIGAIGGSLLQDTAVGIATEGIGEIPLLGGQIGKAALWMNKIFSADGDIGKIFGAVKPSLMNTLRGAAEAVPASENAFLSLDEMARAASYTKMTNSLRFGVNLYGAARTESGFEARDGFNQVKQDLIDQFTSRNNRQPNDDEVADMEKYATAGANVRFGANMALLTLSDAIQFDNVLKPFSSAKKGITASLQKSLEEDSEKIGIKEGTIDTFERKEPQTLRGKIWNVVKPTIPNILSEGIYEEGGQYAAQVATQNYYERKYYADKGIPQGSPDKTPWDPSTTVNLLHSTMQGLQGEFGSTDGIENIVLGGLTAILTGGFEHYYDKLHGNEEEKGVQSTISLLNQNSITGLLQNMFGNTNKSAFLAKEMDDAVKSNDLFKYKNSQSQMFTNFVLAHLQGNRFDVAMEKLNIAKELPQAEFEKAFGIENTTGNKHSVGEYVEALKEKAESIKNNYDAINEVFQNPYKFNSKAKDKESVLENDKHTKFEEWKATLLEHTSDIEDTNRRLASLNNKVATASPLISRPLVQELTHPIELAKLATQYEAAASDLQKSFNEKLVLPEERKNEEKQLKAYQDHAANIKEFLSSPPEGRDDKFLKLFDNLLHFKINGEDANVVDPHEIRKQLIPNLIKDGVDANRLQARKTIAAKAYDVLTSEKGFNKYFSLLQSKEDTSAELSEYHPITPIEVDTAKMAIPVKIADGKEVTFKEGQQYTLNTGTQDSVQAQQATYNGVDDEGNLKFTTPDNQQLVLNPSQVSTLEDAQKEVGENFTKTLTTIGSGSPIVSNVVPHEEDKKKDLTRGPRSTTDPKFEDHTPYDNFHQRHQTFLFNLGSTDPAKFDQNVKPNLRILPVTEKTGEVLGFPKEFTKKIEGQEDTIRAVYVGFEGSKPYLLDHNGKKVQQLDGSPIDPSKIIFSTLSDTNLQYQGGERYTNKSNLDSAKVQEWQNNFRNALLGKDSKGMPMFSFQVSRGIPNIKNVDTRNTITSVGLVTNKDINKVVITIPTQGDVAIAALLNDEGEGIASDATGVNMPLGIPLLNHGGNLIYLNNRKLTLSEAANSFNLLKELARRVGENKIKGESPLDQTILKYLSRILYFSNPQEGKEISPNQIWIDKAGLHFGTSFSVPFFENTVALNEDRIKTFLSDSYHNVNNYELSRMGKEKLEDLKFNELGMKEGKLVATNTWPTYQHYLLTSENAPLATNIAKPQGNEIPIVQKYSVLQVKSFDNKAFESDKKVVAPPKPAVPIAKTKEKKAVATRSSQKRIFWSRHSEDINDQLNKTSGNGTSELTKEGIEKAKKLAEEMLDKGITNIIASPVTRSKQTAEIVSKILGVSVDTISGLSNRLRSWDIGEWANTSDEDFARAERYFVEHPTSKEFEGKKLNEDFQSYVGRIVVAGNEIDAKSPEGTMIITHSKNLNVWDAYNKAGKVWDEKAKAEYLRDKAPDNAKLTTESEKIKSNEIEGVFEFPNGPIRYAEVYNSDDQLVDVRVISGTRKDGTVVPADKFSPNILDEYKNTIAQGLGLISETPSITTTPEVKEIKETQKLANKPDNTVKIAELNEKRNQELESLAKGQNGGTVRMEEGYRKIVSSPSVLTSESDIYIEGYVGEGAFSFGLLSKVIDRYYDTRIEELEKSEESKSPQQNSAAARLLGHKAKPTDTQYRAVNVIPGSYKAGNVGEEFNKAKAMLPDYVQFVMTKNLIKMTGGGKAWGAMRDAGIYVYKNAAEGTTYHEAFELVWQNFLEGKNQLALYNEFKERDGKFTTYQGQEKSFGEANFKEAKEQIADEFAKYVLDKDTPLPTKQRNWFQRVIDFIKNIFLGPANDINSLFKNISEGYFSNYPASQKNIDSIEYKNIHASEALIQDVLQGMTADLFAREFEKDSAIVTQLEENPKQAVATVYGRLFNSMQRFFTSDDPNATDTLQAIYHDKITSTTNEGEQANIIQEFEGVSNQWEFIKNNWDEFTKEHMQFLKVFKVDFSVDDNGEVTMDSTAKRELEDYEKMTGQSDYARDIMTMNARNSASEVVKLTYSTIADREFQKDIIGKSIEQVKAAQGDQKTRIKRENSQVRMPKLAPYAKFFNYVLHNVTNINGIYDIYKKLVAMSNNTRIKSNALVDALVNRLDFKSGFKDKSLDQIKFLLSHENALSKQKPDFVRQFVDDNGNVYFKTSIVNSRVDQVVDDWITAIKSSPAVKTTEDSNFIFDKTLKDIKDPIFLLNSIGIGIHQEDYNNLTPGDKVKFNNEVNALKSVLDKNVGQKLPIFTTKQLGIDSRLINLASLYVDKVVGDDTDSMHFNLDGELTVNFVLPNFAATVLADGNNSKTRAEFIAKNPQFNDIFHRDSIILNELLYDKDGKFTSPINIAVAEGRESADSDNKSASSLTEAERYIHEINNNLQGVFYTLLPADAKTEWAIYTGQYIKASEYFDEVTNENAVSKFTDRMWSNLQTEVALAKDYATNPNRQNITELGKTVDGRKKGESLRFFKDLLNQSDVDSIHKRVIDGEEALENVLNKDQFDIQMRAWAQDKAKTSFDYLHNNKIFGVSNLGNVKLNGLLTDFISKHMGSKRDYFTEGEAVNMLTFREMNYAINNIEMHKFFFGDPAQYSDEMKRIKSFLSGREVSHVDTIGTAEGFNQAANSLLNTVGKVALKEGDPGYHLFKNEMNTLTVYDITAKSTSLEMLQDALGKEDAKPYAKMNEADAQTWHKDTSYRETLLKSGGMRWSQKMEDQHQWEMAWTRQEKEKEGKYKYSSDELARHDIKLLKNNADSEAFFYIMKPIHSGIQSKEGTAVVSLDKTSAAPLYYRFAKEMGAQMADLYDAMEERGTDYIRVESAHKVGIQNDSTIPMYKEDGSINKEGIQKATHEQIPYKYYGIQVDTSSRHESQTEGSQLRSQATGDLMANGTPIDYKGDDWGKMTEEDREKTSPIYSLIKQHEADLTALSNKRYQNLLTKLGVTEDEDGTYKYKDVKKVSDFLLNEITRRELPNNLRDAIQPDENDPSQFKVPLEALSNYQSVRAILWSTIEKNIIRPKVSGGMKTQLAATGWEKAHRVQVSNVNGKQVLTSSELKFYGKDKNGNTTKCEVYMPFWFGAKIRQRLEADGTTFKTEREFRDHILNYLNETTEGQKLLQGIGFRIPTQRDNSIESFVVKDFLPSQMGDSIILPSEITAKAGSDFDIDKMNTYLRNFFINDKGYPEAVQFENIDTNDPEQLKWYYNKYLFDRNKEFEKWHRDRATNKFVNAIFGDDEDSEPEYVPSLQEFMHEAQGKSAYEMNSLEALENKYFDTLEKIYALPEKFNGLVSPNDASDLKNIALKIAKLRDPNFSETKQPFGRVLDSLWMMQERHKYLVGKKGVGIAAVSQKNLNVNQGAQVYIALPRDVKVRLPYNSVTIGEAKFVSLSAIKNRSGENISKVNASFIDGYVDIAKGAWIIDMGATDELAKNFLLLNKWGTNPYDTALFMNQPAIRMYTNEQSTRRSVAQINKDIEIKNSRQLYEYVNSRFKTGGAGKVFLNKNKPETYDREMMENMIAKYGRGEAFTVEENKLQMQMLSDHQSYDSLAWDMFRFFQGYNWDTSRSNDPNLTRRHLIAEQRAKNGSIQGLQNIFDKSFIGATRLNTLKTDNALRTLLPIQSGKSGEILDAVAQDLAERRGVTQEDFRKTMLKTELSMLDYITQTGVVAGGKTLNGFINSLLLSNNPVARYLKAIQDSGNLTLTSNPIIQNLRANLDYREGKPSNIELIEKDNDSYTSNIWTDALRELADSQQVISIDDNPKNDLSVGQIYRRMVLASILQSGTKRSSISFTHLIPNEHYSVLIKDAVREGKADMDNFYDKNILYRSNWEDNTLVPIVPSVPEDVFDEFGNISTRRTYPGFNSKGFIQHIKDQGIENVSKVLKLSAFDWKDKKVVKTIEFKKDLETKQITERKIRLFQRVDTWSADAGVTPLIASKKEILEGDFMESKVEYAVFKEINKWGDGAKVQEYYDDRVHSQLESNPQVTELDDQMITYGIMNTGYRVNTEDMMAGEIAEKYANKVVTQGEGVADTEQEPEDKPLKNGPVSTNKAPIQFKEVKIEDTKRAGKKDFFHIADSSGEVGEAQGYAVTVKSHPDLDLYVAKSNESNLWTFSDNKTGLRIATGDTAKEAIQIGIERINNAVKTGSSPETLNNLGVVREIDDVLKDKDKGCKS